MKIAISSNDFIHITGKPGRSRQFLIYQVENNVINLVEKVTLPDNQPTYHDLHHDDTTPHPVDGMVLIATEAGEGFSARMKRRGITVHITNETNPITAIEKLLAGNLPTLSEKPHNEGDC